MNSRDAAIIKQQERQDAKKRKLLDNLSERSESRCENLWHIPRYIKSVVVRYK